MNQQYSNNPFAGMTSGDQSIGVRYPYLEDGDYKLKIHKAAVRGRSKPFYIIEHEVIESNVPSRPAGMRCCSFIDLSNKDMRGKNVTGFLCAVFGVDPTQLPKDSAVAPWVDQNAGRNVEWAEYANWSVQENNPLAGAQVGCRVQTTQTQAGDDFSVHNWTPLAMMTIGPVVQPRAPRQQQPQLPQGPAPAGAGNWGPPGAGQMPAGGAPQGGGWGPPQQPGQAPGNGAAPAWGPPGPGVAQPQQPQGPAFGPPGGAPAPQPAQQPNFGPPPQGGFGGTPWGGGQSR